MARRKIARKPLLVARHPDTGRNVFCQECRDSFLIEDTRYFPSRMLDGRPIDRHYCLACLTGRVGGLSLVSFLDIRDAAYTRETFPAV